MVTPCVGVWIETIKEEDNFVELKVTPCVGVWIETGEIRNRVAANTCHTLRGCVD